MRVTMRAIVVLCAATASVFAQAKFRPHDVASGMAGGYQVVIADMNHDGKPDIIALASGLKELAWYENPSWTKHVIVDGINQPINLAVVKNDKSGVTIALATDFSPNAARSVGTVMVLESQGDVTQPFKRTDIDKLPTSHRLRMMNGLVVNAPLTNEKAVAPDYHGGTPLVYYKPGEWKRQTISNDDDGVVHCIYPVDWDGDGKQQLLTASFQGVFLIRQKGSSFERTKLLAGSPEPWPKSGASDVAVGKAGNETFLATIEPWHGNVVAVYTKENGEWKRNVIDSSIQDGHVLLTADLDGNRHDVIIASGRGRGTTVYIYRWDGKQWAKSQIEEGSMPSAGCATGDINGDGKLDVVCIATATANVKWYENLGLK